MTEKQAIFTLMGGRVHMRRGRYNPTSDAVWLAAFAPHGIKTVLDVGVGTGAVSLCIAANCSGIQLTGLDISPEMLAECEQNAKLNNTPIELINTDITTWHSARTFDLVITNPPYFRGTPARHNAHHNADITKWVRRCIARVRPRGYFCTIVDATRIADVLAVMQSHCGDIQILPLFGAHHWAERILVRGRVGTRGGTTVWSGLAMNNDMILRDGLTIDTVLTRLGWI